MRGRIVAGVLLIGIASIGGLAFVHVFLCSRAIARPAHAVVSQLKRKPKSNKKRRRQQPGPRLYSGVPLKIYSGYTDSISIGITYTEQIVSRNHWRVGIIHADLTADSLGIDILKAKDSAFRA